MKTALASYAFLNAKLKTRVSKLLSNDAMNELIRAKSLPETLPLLRSTRYEGIEASYAATGDLLSCEAALAAADDSLFEELLPFAKGAIRDYFSALSLRFEIDKVKNALRLWFDSRTRGGDVTGKAAYVDRKAIANKIDIDSVLTASDEAELLKEFAGTPYLAILAARLGPAIEQRNLFSLELALDVFYFDAVSAAAARLAPKDRAVAQRALAMDADSQNADRLTRFKTYFSMGAEEALRCLIPYGAAARSAGIAEAYAQDGSADLAKRVLGGSLGRIASFAVSGGDGGGKTALMQKAFRAFALDEARRLLGGYPFSIGIALAYSTLRRDEARQIMTILNAKYYGLSEERIRNAL